MLSANPPKLVIISGHNGSGKTTFAREYLKTLEIDFLNADEIAAGISEDIESVKISAGKEFFRRAKSLIAKNKSFAIESTLSGRYLLKLIGELSIKGYSVRIVYIFLDSHETAIERINTRVAGGGHGIPDEDVKRRFGRSLNNFWYLYRELVNEWELHYNGFDRSVQVAFGVGSGYTVSDEKLFNVFRGLIDEKRNI